MTRKNRVTPVKWVCVARHGCTYCGAILKQDHGNLGVAVIEHYKFCRGSTEIFRQCENNLRTRYLIYCIFNPNFHIFIFPSSIKSKTINWSNIFITFGPQPYRIQASTRIGNVQTMHWEYMIFNILSMKSSDSNTNMMHQAGWWSLGKLCLGDSIFQI